jgi:hypothetical protein
MKTVDLTQGQRSLSEVLALAKTESVLIHSASGEDFLLEQADDYDREVAALGASERFSSFLKTRSGETGDIPLSEIREKRGL